MDIIRMGKGRQIADTKVNNNREQRGGGYLQKKIVFIYAQLRG